MTLNGTIHVLMITNYGVISKCDCWSYNDGLSLLILLFIQICVGINDAKIIEMVS